jgi:hypothetical protein
MKFKVADHLSIRTIENEIFILNRNDSHLHTFNESGASLWKIIEHNSSSEAMVDELMQQYTVDRGLAVQDVDEFLVELLKMHLIDQL